jgi:hypothetical protein
MGHRAFSFVGRPARTRQKPNAARGLEGPAGSKEKGRFCMQDALMLLFTVVFFGVAFLYVKACHKLR